MVFIVIILVCLWWIFGLLLLMLIEYCEWISFGWCVSSYCMLLDLLFFLLVVSVRM